MSVAECAKRTGFADRTIESWLYGEAEPRACGLQYLSAVLGESFVLALLREWGFALRPEEAADEMTREIGALLATAGFVVKRRAA